MLLLCNGVGSSKAYKSEKSSAQYVAETYDLLWEILLLLPVKSLLRFRCISKHWFSLISDEQFVATYAARNAKLPPASLIFCKGRDINQTTLLPLNDIDRVNNPKVSVKIPTSIAKFSGCNRILQCRKGLSLCRCHYFRGECKIKVYYVCNFATRESRVLPRNVRRGKKCFDHRMVLDYDPSKSPHYRVVCVWTKDKEKGFRINGIKSLTYRIEIYSSQTRTWESGNGTYDVPNYCTIADRMLLNGVVLWDYRRFSSFHIDIDKECMKSIDLPEGSNECGDAMLEEYCGKNYFVDTDCLSEINVYELDTEKFKWFRKYSINLDNLTFDVPMEYSCFHVHGVIRIDDAGGDGDDFLLVLELGCKVCLFDPKKKVFAKVLLDMRCDMKSFTCVRNGCHQHIEIISRP